MIALRKQKKILQQVIPLLRDIESLFAGLSTDIPGITEEDKIDIGIMSKTIHILISQLAVMIDVLASQTLNAKDYENWGQLSAIIATITSDAYQVI